MTLVAAPAAADVTLLYDPYTRPSPPIYVVQWAEAALSEPLHAAPAVTVTSIAPAATEPSAGASHAHGTVDRARATSATSTPSVPAAPAAPATPSAPSSLRSDNERSDSSGLIETRANMGDPSSAAGVEDQSRVDVRFVRGSNSIELEVALDGTTDASDARALSDFAGPRESNDIPVFPQGLLVQLARVAQHFNAPIEIVSGYRPNARANSRHRHGAAMDFRMPGVDLLTLHRFLDGTEQTGLGVYPNSNFVHLDVRERTTRWVDYSASGQEGVVQLMEVGAALPAPLSREMMHHQEQPPSAAGTVSTVDAERAPTDPTSESTDPTAE